MRIVRSTNAYSFDLGVYLINWGYPIAHEWEIGIHLFKWNIGLELHRKKEEQ